MGRLGGADSWMSFSSWTSEAGSESLSAWLVCDSGLPPLVEAAGLRDGEGVSTAWKLGGDSLP